MDIRNDLYTFRPMRRDEALKRRVSEQFVFEDGWEMSMELTWTPIFSAGISPTGAD